ncbi:MAG: outer membrane protein assembly factor [Nevskia sp.]|nr:outer membrane protein assembly factor [Nevskia sp.]
MSFRLVALLSFALCASAPAFAGIDVRVRGLGSEEADNVYAQIGILNYARKTDAGKADYDPAEVQRRFEQGPADIRKALQPFGWYAPAIKSELRGAKPDWTAVYTVDAGAPVKLATVDLRIDGEGRDNPALAAIVRAPRLRPGDRLKHAEYEGLKSRLLQVANGQGYLDASFSRHELRVDVDAGSAAVLLTLDTGPRYYFGEVSIDDDAGLDDALLRRYVTLVPGEPFDQSKILSTQFALTDLDYFRLVEVEPQKSRAGPDRRIPVLIHGRAKPPRAYKFGLGYGTDTGPRALAGVEFRRLNAEGHKLRIELRPSQNISTGIAEYRIPVGHSPGDSVSFTAEGLKQNFQGIREDLYSFGVSYNRQVWNWERRPYLVYTNDTYSLPREAQTNSKLLTPGLSLSRTDIDDPIYPRSGWFALFDVHGGTHELLSDSNFVQGLVRLRGVLPLAPHWRLLARFEEGGTILSDFGHLPPSQRFFAGGDESVRGYAFRSLAPRDAYGNIFGGKYLTTGSVETDVDVYRNYGLALFGDAGGADDTVGVRLHYGAGIGLRYRLPFGAVALDLAHPFDQGASPVHVHIGVRVGL